MTPDQIRKMCVLAAREIGCDPDAVWAVAYVESSLGAAAPLRRFEPHLFRRQTGGRARSYAAAQRDDPEAADRSCSIGVFQVLGKWHGHLGYKTARAMMAALSDPANIEAQAAAFVVYCQDVAPAAGSALRARDPQAFALAYNGPAALDRGYHLKIKAALERAGGKAARVLREGATGEAVRYLQRLLKIDADGWYGAETRAAVEAFQARAGLKVDGVVGRKTWEALDADAADLARDAMDVAERIEGWVRGARKRALGVTGLIVTAAGWFGVEISAAQLEALLRGDWGAASALVIAAKPYLPSAALAALAAAALYFAARSLQDGRRIKATLPGDIGRGARRPLGAGYDDFRPRPHHAGGRGVLRPSGGPGGGGRDSGADGRGRVFSSSGDAARRALARLRQR